MRYVILLVLSLDAGLFAEGPLGAMLPPWGGTEELARTRWPELVPVATAEGDDPNWRRQEIRTVLFGVTVQSVAVYFDSVKGLTKASFGFASEAGKVERGYRDAIARGLESSLGKADFEGSCWRIWETPTATIVLEIGRIRVLSLPARQSVSVDDDCRLLAPVVPMKATRRAPL